MSELMDWMFGLTIAVSFLAAFALGANDVANMFATSVGAKVLTLRQALVVASIFEFSGAVALGAAVAKTIRSGIVDIALFDETPQLLLMGFFSALFGASIWLLFATYLKLPVSATHSTVGAMIGWAVYAKGWDSVQWEEIGYIALSWVLSPIVSGIVSCFLFLVIRKVVLRAAQSFRAGLRILPAVYGLTLAINVYFVVSKSGAELEWWIEILIAVGAGLLVAVLAATVIVPFVRRRITDQLEAESGAIVEAEGNATYGADAGVALGKYKDGEIEEQKQPPPPPSGKPSFMGEAEVFDEKTERLFSFLQVLTACFGSFAHGANDVANAIAPLAGAYAIWEHGVLNEDDGIPLWILVMGGVGISVGLLALGKRVIETMGSNLATITPSRGFNMEIGAALTVIVATFIGMPISSTHCKVGSIVGVGWADGAKALNWRIVGEIFLSWIATLPGAAIFALASFAACQAYLENHTDYPT